MYLLYLALGAFLLGGGVIVVTNMLGERIQSDSTELDLQELQDLNEFQELQEQI